MVEIHDFRAIHADLRNAIDDLVLAARHLPGATPEERRDLHVRVAEFLHDEVEPHMRDDEREMYPEVASRFRSQFATASMNYDHIAIRRWIAEIDDCDSEDVPRLQELLYGLHALIRVHMWKETELFLGALESPTWPASA